jgi:hypothetical protein
MEIFVFHILSMRRCRVGLMEFYRFQAKHAQIESWEYYVFHVEHAQLENGTVSLMEFLCIPG